MLGEFFFRFFCFKVYCKFSTLAVSSSPILYKERNREERIKYYQLSLEILSKNLEVKALYLLMNQDLKIIKTVFMPGQRKGKKFIVSKKENEEKEKIY